MRAIGAAGFAAALVATIIMPQAAMADGNVNGVDYRGVENSSGQFGFWDVEGVNNAVPLTSGKDIYPDGYQIGNEVTGQKWAQATWGLMNNHFFGGGEQVIVTGEKADQWTTENGQAGTGSDQLWSPERTQKQQAASAGVISKYLSERGQIPADDFDWASSGIDENSYYNMAYQFAEASGTSGQLRFKFVDATYANKTLRQGNGEYVKLNSDQPRLMVNDKPAPYVPVKFRAKEYTTDPGNRNLKTNSPAGLSTAGEWFVTRTDEDGYVPVDMYVPNVGYNIVAVEVVAKQFGCDLNEYNGPDESKLAGSTCDEGAEIRTELGGNSRSQLPETFVTPPATPYMECGAVALPESTYYWKWTQGVYQNGNSWEIRVTPRFAPEFSWDEYDGDIVTSVFTKEELEQSKAKCAPVIEPAASCGVESTVTPVDNKSVTFTQSRTGNKVVTTGSRTKGNVLNYVHMLENPAGSGKFVTSNDVSKAWVWETTIPPVEQCLVGVTPDEPKLVPSNQCGVEGTINIPTTNGVSYSQSRKGNIVTVTAKPLDGYKLNDGAESEWNIEIPPVEDCPVIPTDVTPKAPELIPSNQCDVEGTVKVNQTEGVSYSQSRDGQSVTVVAKPIEGYKFSDGAVSEWKIEIPKVEKCEPIKPIDPEKPTPPVKPTVTPEKTLPNTGGANGALAAALAALLSIAGAAVFVTARIRSAKSDA